MELFSIRIQRTFQLVSTQGNKVYFFEDELIKWVEKGRVATLQEKYTSKRNY